MISSEGNKSEERTETEKRPTWMKTSNRRSKSAPASPYRCPRGHPQAGRRRAKPSGTGACVVRACGRLFHGNVPRRRRAVQAHLPDAPWRSLVVRLGYPFGFLMVVGGRQQLFTENTLSPIIPLLERRDFAAFRKVAKLWAAVLVANLIGAHIAAWVLSNTPAFKPDVQHAFQKIAREAIAVGFSTAILRGIFTAWLIAMMVWILAAMHNTRLPVILIMTYVIGLGSFTHIVAGSAEALFLVWNGSISWWSYAGGYALPTLIGNVLGGIALVSALNHAQVVAGTGRSGPN